MLNSSRKDRTFAAAVVIILIGIAVTVLHKAAERRGRPDIVTSIVRSDLLGPANKARHALDQWARQQLVNPLRAQRLAHENTRLRRQVMKLTMENEVLHDQAAQVDTMRRMLKLAQTAPPDLRAGLVIALKPSPVRDNALVKLSEGAHAEKQDIVIDSGGALVGQVVQVNGAVCDVLLITDPGSSVGAMVVPVGRPGNGKAVFGVCQGARGSLLSMVDMPVDADVGVGDRVVSSGLGSIFPKGVPIGTVSSIHADPTRSLKSATISTVDDFNLLDEVFVRQ